MVNLWQSGRDGMQGAFLQPIAGLWAKKATQQTARDRLITEHRELFRGSLSHSAATHAMTGGCVQLCVACAKAMLLAWP